MTSNDNWMVKLNHSIYPNHVNVVFEIWKLTRYIKSYQIVFDWIEHCLTHRLFYFCLTMACFFY